MSRRTHIFLPVGAAALTLVGAASLSRPCSAVAPAEDHSGLLLDAELGETVWPDEVALTERIAAAIRKSIADRYGDGKGPARRDAHPKAHGCVRAEFQVEPDLPASLAHGVFQPGARYKAWIRFSNGSGDPTRPDKRGDARGMAIKLLGVVGDKILPEEKQAESQDFVLISNPTFFADDPARYATFIERGTSGHPLVAATAPFALGLKGFRVARQIISKHIGSPLETRYWSTVPSVLGTGNTRRAVKYSARPALPATTAIPDDPSPNYLREAMRRTLSATEVRFDFLVQPAAGPWMSVEDSRTEWTEAEAPFIKVATITIPVQAFDSPAQDAFCENLSFTPWHALPEHRPLGGINRVRRVVYQSISALRHEMNGTVPKEPTGEEVFE